jgi:hypothetical protein
MTHPEMSDTMSDSTDNGPVVIIGGTGKPAVE